MKIHPHGFAAALLALLLPLVSLAETRLQVKDIEVKGRPAFDHDLNHGYQEYRFIVINHDAAKAHTVQIMLADISKTVSVPAGNRLEFPMFHNRNKGYHRMIVTVDNRHQDNTLFTESHRGNHNRKTSLLLSKSINQDDLQARIEKLSGTTRASFFSNTYITRRTDLSPNEWSDNWLAYSSFDGIVMQASDIASMPPKLVAALKQYVESGGILTIIGTGQCPFFGNSVTPLPNTETARNIYAVGLGRCITYSDEQTDCFLEEEITEWKANNLVFDLNCSEHNSNKKFPVVEKITLPVRGFLLLVTLFAVIAGPLTIIVLAKTNRRIWLLWVIPLESAVACGIVLVYSLFSEGITPTVRMKNITLLDQQQHTAVSLGWIGYYCPQKPSDGLFFADDLEINRVKPNIHLGSSLSTETIDWTRGQHLQKGWINSRIPTFLMCRRNSIRRERLEITGTEVVNGLGADIKQLWVCAPDGAVYEAQNLQAGQQGQIVRNYAKIALKDPGKLRSLFTEKFKAHNNDEFLKDHPEYYLVQGTYIAVLKGAPFMDHGLGNRKVKLTAESIVYGILPKEEQQ